ncbi:MAG TPA: hypothetical protein VKN99_03910 [Polyangia bacterium]|nr:hypothetical protein [Polyangia bacterium]
MRYRIALAIPLLCAAALLALEGHAFPDAAALHALWHIEVPLVKALGGLGCLAAALRFTRGDYLRRAWFFLSMCYFLLLAKDILFGGGSHFQQPQTFSVTVQWLRGSITLVANACTVYGTFVLARTARVAGITLPGSARSRALVFACAVAVALAIAGQATWLDLREVARGNMAQLVGAASDLGDIVAVALIAPLLLTALALRGGLLGWPWALLTASYLGWLCYDATATIGYSLQAEPLKLRALEELFRCLACTFALGAGLAQRWAVGGSGESS